LVAIGVEVGLRLFRPTQGGAIVKQLSNTDSKITDYLAKLKKFKFDDDLGVYKCRPGKHRFADIIYHCNSLGFRGPEWRTAGIDNVLLLGDSQLFGWLLPFENTIAFHLSKLLDVNILNTGIGGYGQREELRILRAYGPKVLPRRIIVFFFENDLKDNKREESPFMVVRGYLVRKKGFDGLRRDPEHVGFLLDAWESGRKQPLVRYLKSELASAGSSRRTKGSETTGEGFLDWINDKASHSLVLALVREAYSSLWERIKGLLKRLIRGDDQYWSIWTRDSRFRATIAALNEIFKEIRNLGAEPLLVAIPSPTEMEKWTGGDLYTNSNFIGEYGKRRNVPTIILAKYFEPGNHCKFFGPNGQCDDKHLSKAGARLTAELVARFVKENKTK
jgi:hypothetical protein